VAGRRRNSQNVNELYKVNLQIVQKHTHRMLMIEAAGAYRVAGIGRLYAATSSKFWGRFLVAGRDRRNRER